MNVNVAYTIRRSFYEAKALWLIRFSLNEIPSSGFDSSFTLMSIASSPVSGNIENNLSKDTTMIHAQLFQRPLTIPSPFLADGIVSVV